MNTFSTSPHMALDMARYRMTEAVEQAEARATLRAIRAQQKSERASTRNPFAALTRRFAVHAPTVTSTPATNPGR